MESGKWSVTTWLFVPPGTQWSNRAEAAVKVMKHTLSMTINSQQKLNYAELESILMVIAILMNERPISARSFDQYTFQTITLNQFLLGRTGTHVAENVYDDSGSPLERLQFKEELETMWWNQFYVQVLPSLVPLAKWTTKFPNRKPGDIVLVYYPEIKKGLYRMARVVQVYPDSSGKVRTVLVHMRPRQKLSDGKVKYLAKDLEPMTLPVHRTVLILPMEETIMSEQRSDENVSVKPVLESDYRGGEGVLVRCGLVVNECKMSGVCRIIICLVSFYKIVRRPYCNRPYKKNCAMPIL